MKWLSIDYIIKLHEKMVQRTGGKQKALQITILQGCCFCYGGEKSELNRTPTWISGRLMGLQPRGGTTPVLPNSILPQQW